MTEDKAKSQEFKRRLKKMRKHTQALRRLVVTDKQKKILDEVEGGLTWIEGLQSVTEAPRSGPKAVTG